MKQTIVRKRLPPRIVRPSGELRRHAQHAERITFLLLLLVLLAFFILVPDWTGRAVTSTQVNVTQTIEVNCTLPLQPGLNIISLNCVSNNEDRDLVLANTDTVSILAMYEYRNKQADQWRVYNPALPSYVVQDLSTFSRLKGYLVYAGNATLIEYAGTLAAESTIPVFADNNLLGYPAVSTDQLPGALTTIADTYSRVRTYNGTAWIEFNTTEGNATGLSALTPLRGYWITSSSIDSWIVNYNNS